MCITVSILDVYGCNTWLHHVEGVGFACIYEEGITKMHHSVSIFGPEAEYIGCCQSAKVCG